MPFYEKGGGEPMKKKIIFISLLASLLITTKVHADDIVYSTLDDPMTPDEIKEWQLCGDDFKEEKDKIASSLTYWKDYVTKKGLDYQKSVNVKMPGGGYVKKTFTLERQYALRDCVAVYGTPADVEDTYFGSKQTYAKNPDYTKNPNEIQPRFYGFYLEIDGVTVRPYSNPYYPDTGGSDKENFLLERNFVSYPWTNSDLNRQAFSGIYDLFPPSYQGDVNDVNRLIALRTAIDRWYLLAHPNAATIGNFINYNSLIKKTFIKGSLPNPDVASTMVPTASQTDLTYYANFSATPGKWNAGSFVLYHQNCDGCQFWYTTYFMPPEKNILEDDTFNDLEIVNGSVSFTPAPIQLSETTISSFKLTIKNNGNQDVTGPFTLSYKWDLSSDTQTACTTVGSGQTIKAGGTLTVTVDPTKSKANCKTTGAKLTYPVTTAASENFVFVTNINYDRTNPANETKEDGTTPSWDNNVEKTTVTVNGIQNASVLIATNKTSFDANESLNIKYTVKNDMKSTIVAPCTTTVCQSGKTVHQYSIYDLNTGKYVVQNKTATYSIAMDSSKTLSIADKIPSGHYRLTVSIPYYNAETNPKKWTDNQDTFDFDVKIVPPDNTSCKLISAPGMKIKSGTVKGISKMCIGAVPNFPSTTTEGGQGTYYYVKYSFLPMPLPAYDVYNYDDVGLSQKYVLNEKSNELGNTNTFLYYPTSATNSANLTGPYAAGPHDFYHYLYRGRMFAKDVTFKFSVQGPKTSEGTYKAISRTKDGTAAIGEIHYTVPTECYDPNTLDYRSGDTYEYCRDVTFFLPNGQTDLSNMYQLPTTDKRIYFKNTGVYAFAFEANENQFYRYQKDNGTEVQGDATGTIPTEKGYAPYEMARSEWASGNTYTIRDDFKNYCYTEEDAFNNIAFDGSQCFHHHGEKFHYWKFDWSLPSTYNGTF